MGNSVNTLIFDLGGVVLNLDYQLTSSAFKNLGFDHFDEFYSQGAQSKLFDDFETGKISSQFFINSLLPYFPQGVSVNKVVAAWNAMILDFPLERLNLLLALKKEYRVLLLSNTNDLHIHAVRRSLTKVSDLQLEGYFDKIYLSHEVGFRKPNADIFEFVCQDQNMDAGDALFIDDTIRHVEGAIKYGLNAIHLTDQTILDLVF